VTPRSIGAFPATQTTPVPTFGKQGCSALRHSVANPTPFWIVKRTGAQPLNKLTVSDCGVCRAIKAGADQHVPRHQTSIRSRGR